MKGTDLPDDVKQQLLKQIEKQVGSDNYRQMVEQVGEDKILDLAFEKANEIAKDQSSNESEKEGGWGDTLTIIGGGLAMAFCFGLGARGREGFNLIGAVILLCLVLKGTGFWGKVLRIARKSAWLLIPYGLGLMLLGGRNEFEYHILAIPVGLLWLWLMSRQ